MRLEKRDDHSVLYLAIGTQAIRIKKNATKKQVTEAIKHLPPGTHGRRSKAISALTNAGLILKDSDYKIMLPGYLCKRCGHTWLATGDEEPICCAKCKSPYWRSERKSGGKA